MCLSKESYTSQVSVEEEEKKRRREMSSKQIGKHAIEATDMFAWKKEKRKIYEVYKKELCSGNSKVRYTRQVCVEEAAKETEEENVS